jgi:hypothetical protein
MTGFTGLAGCFTLTVLEGTSITLFTFLKPRFIRILALCTCDLIRPSYALIPFRARSTVTASRRISSLFTRKHGVSCAVIP